MQDGWPMAALVPDVFLRVGVLPETDGCLHYSFWKPTRLTQRSRGKVSSTWRPCTGGPCR